MYGKNWRSHLIIDSINAVIKMVRTNGDICSICERNIVVIPNGQTGFYIAGETVIMPMEGICKHCYTLINEQIVGPGWDQYIRDGHIPEDIQKTNKK